MSTAIRIRNEKNSPITVQVHSINTRVETLHIGPNGGVGQVIRPMHLWITLIAHCEEMGAATQATHFKLSQSHYDICYDRNHGLTSYPNKAAINVTGMSKGSDVFTVVNRSNSLVKAAVSKVEFMWGGSDDFAVIRPGESVDFPRSSKDEMVVFEDYVTHDLRGYIHTYPCEVSFFGFFI